MLVSYFRFRARRRVPARFATLDPAASRAYSVDPLIGEDYYHVQWAARPGAGRFAGETWLIGDQPWADAPAFMIWGLGAQWTPGRPPRFALMLRDWPRAWCRQPAAAVSR